MWESVVRDFSLEVVGTPLFLAGNSIGGYTALSAAAHLKSYCLGLVLCNSQFPNLKPHAPNL
jgi:alpha-beta hydrolase superfamily lysophospholipase